MNIVENFRTRVVQAVQTTASAADDYVLPTPGVKSLQMRVIATMGNAADLALTLKYADDAAGTNAAVFDDVPLFVNGVRQTTDTEVYTIGDATGNFIVDWIIDPAKIPDGKYIGMSYANSNAANIMTAILMEDVAYKPTVT